VNRLRELEANPSEIAKIDAQWKVDIGKIDTKGSTSGKWEELKGGLTTTGTNSVAIEVVTKELTALMEQKESKDITPQDLIQIEVDWQFVVNKQKASGASAEEIDALNSRWNNVKQQLLSKAHNQTYTSIFAENSASKFTGVIPSNIKIKP